MLDKKAMAKDMANSKVAQTVKPEKSRPTRTLLASDFADEIRGITHLCSEIDRLDGTTGTLKETLDGMPVLFNTLWKALSKKGASVPTYTDQADAFESDILKVHRAVGQAKERALAEWKERRRAERMEWRPVQCESGTVYVPQWKLKLLTGNLQRGIHTLLKGPPGAGKTEVGRAAATLVGWEFFHMEVSGFTDVSQLEYERVILSRDGAPHMELRPTPLTLALQAVKDGKRVVLYIDEIKRVGDPSILNPFLLLLAQGEYHSVVTKDVYTVTPDNFVVLASANDASGFNFSGNNRKGMDDALSNRFDEVVFDMPPGDLMQSVILPSRLPGMEVHCYRQVALVYTTCQAGVDPHFNTRDAFRLLNAWDILGTDDYTLAELLEVRYQGTPEQKKKLLTELSAKGIV